MRRILAVLGLLFLLGAAVAYAEVTVTKINDLVEQAKALDGQTVTIQGEVIGDVMIRGDSGWINITDGTNDIGVLAPAGALRTIQYAGRYHQRGDQVRISGQFRRADPEHGGDLTLRAQSLEVLEAGGPVAHPVRDGRPLAAAGALALAGVLGYLRWRRRAAA